MVKINKKKKKRISYHYQTRHQKRSIITEHLTKTEFHLSETKTQYNKYNQLRQYFTNENITHHIYHTSIYYQRTLERNNLIVFS